MRAAVLHGKEDVRIEERHEPPLGPGEVRIGIEVALTCGTDLKVFKRGYHARMIVPPPSSATNSPASSARPPPT